MFEFIFEKVSVLKGIFKFIRVTVSRLDESLIEPPETYPAILELEKEAHHTDATALSPVVIVDLVSFE